MFFTFSQELNKNFYLSSLFKRKEMQSLDYNAKKRERHNKLGKKYNKI